MSKKSFANQIAAHLAPTTTPVNNTVTVGGVTLTAEQFAALTAIVQGIAPAATPAPAAQPARRGRKAKAEAPAVAPVIPISAPVAPAAVPAPAVPVTDSELLAQAKVNECHRAAKAAVKAAGLAWNGKKGAESKGGKFTPGYWTTYWAGYNSHAKVIGIPESTPPTK